MRHICDKKKAPQETCGAFLFKMFSKKFSSLKKCSIIVMYIWLNNIIFAIHECF